MLTKFKPFGTEAMSSSLAWATIVGQFELSSSAREFADHCSPLTTLDGEVYHITSAMKLEPQQGLAVAAELGNALTAALGGDVKLQVHACEAIALTPHELNAAMLGMAKLMTGPRRFGVDFSSQLDRTVVSGINLSAGPAQVEPLPGGWVPADRFRAPRGERLLVRRTTDGSLIGNPDHPGYGSDTWVEISQVAGVGGRFSCDYMTTGRVTHWMLLPSVSLM